MRSVRAVVACAVAIGCGSGSLTVAANRAAPAPPEACTDHRYAMDKWLSLVASDDPHDTDVPYDLVDSAWRAAEPSFAPCFRGYTPVRADKPLRIGVEFKISENGVVHAIATWGPEATIDRCVCETIARIAFPHIHPRVAATLAVGP